MIAPVSIDREEAIKRTFQAAFLALDDFRSKNPAAAARIDQVIAEHMRSVSPMTFMVDTGPVLLAPVAEVSRELADGTKYHLEHVDSGVRLHLSHPDAALLPVEVIRLRADLEACSL